MPGLAPFKQQALMRDLRMRLQLTISGVSFADSLDASSNPVLEISKGGETEYITIYPSDPHDGRIDALGIPQTRYSPHILKLVEAADAAAVDDEMRAKVLAECVKSFCYLKLYNTPAMPTSVDDVTAVQVAGIRSDAINPLTSQQ